MSAMLFSVPQICFVQETHYMQAIFNKWVKESIITKFESTNAVVILYFRNNKSLLEMLQHIYFIFSAHEFSVLAALCSPGFLC